MNGPDAVITCMPFGAGEVAVNVLLGLPRNCGCLTCKALGSASASLWNSGTTCPTIRMQRRLAGACVTTHKFRWLKLSHLNSSRARAQHLEVEYLFPPQVFHRDAAGTPVGRVRDGSLTLVGQVVPPVPRGRVRDGSRQTANLQSGPFRHLAAQN